MEHPNEQPAGTEEPFKFGRLLLLLGAAIALIALVAVVSSSYLP